MLSKLVLFGNINPGIRLHLWNTHADSVQSLDLQDLRIGLCGLQNGS